MVAVDFQLEACPHCGSDAEVREHAVYRYQCKACGAPRIPTNRRWMTTPSSVTRHLKQVRGHHIQRNLWLTASWALWIVTTLCALFGAGTAWSLEFGAAGWTFVTILTLLPMVLALVSRVLAAGQKRLSHASRMPGAKSPPSSLRVLQRRVAAREPSMT
jgi:ribosomal protein S27AE